MTDAEALVEELKAKWVNAWAGVDSEYREFLSRYGLEPVSFVDCLVTPSGSPVIGFVKGRRESANVYRVIYIVRYPDGKPHLGEGLALFADEPQKHEQRYSSPRDFQALV